MVALVATSGVVWLSVRSRIVPFVVVTDNLGRPVASGLADQASTANEQLKRSTVIEWVENLRLVTTDGIAQRRAIDRVYAHIASGSPAQTFISDFYRTGQPFTRAQAETVSVDVQSVLQDSEETFEVEWVPLHSASEPRHFIRRPIRADTSRSTAAPQRDAVAATVELAREVAPSRRKF
jgi:type IV secretion system protein VirB5